MGGVCSESSQKAFDAANGFEHTQVIPTWCYLEVNRLFHIIVKLSRLNPCVYVHTLCISCEFRGERPGSGLIVNAFVPQALVSLTPSHPPQCHRVFRSS